MKRHIHQRNAQRGFTLVEVMVAFTVLAFGLLTVAGFQSKLVSGSSLNKARSEAISLAQQKLDQIRNYTDEATLVANLEGRAPVAGETFPADVSDGNYPDDGAGGVAPESLPGINAAFERQWSVIVAGEVADVAVTVSWEDPRQGTQSVSLGTALTWKNPRGGAIIAEASEPKVPSATGRAQLGSGEVSVSDIPDAARHDNGITAAGDFDNDDDYELVDLTTEEDGMARVVLTLRGACNTDSGECTDFVRVKGRVYIDNTTSSLEPADVYVLASDAAYCARELSNATTTATGDYTYYDYTCFLGGGWHGNIGVVSSVSNTVAQACVGDPDATADGADAWKRIELVRRRVYRGMIHKFTDSGSGAPVQDSDGNIMYYAVTNADGDNLIFSRGIADAVRLPDAAFRPAGHDFVILGGNPNQTTVDDCVGALTRTDAVSGSLFNGVPGDFVCLNNDAIPNTYADGVDPNSYSEYLDPFREDDVYRAPNDCPFDPSDPPSYRYEISGDISTGGTTPDSMQVVTSDGTENCRWTISGGTTSYECDIYVREDADGNLNGWNGTITVKPAANFLCAPPDAHPVDETTAYTNPAAQEYDNKLSDISGENYTCQVLASPQVTGTISAPGSDLRGATIEVDDPTAECTFTPPGDSAIVEADGPVDEATFTCKLIEPSVGAGWSGTITFVPPEGMPADACNATEWTWSTPALHESTEALAPDSIGDGDTAPDALECRVPQHAWLVGELSVVAPLTQETLLDTLQINAQGCSSCSCTFDSTASPLSYTCNLSYYGTDGWYGDISVVPGNPDVVCEPALTTLSGVTGSDVSPYPGPAISCEQDLSGPVVISGNIRVYDLARTRPTTPSITGGGTCTLNNGAAVPASGTYRDIPYSCTTPVIEEGMTWSGSITFSDTDAKTFCYGNPGEYTDLEPRAVLEGQNVLIEKNSVSCP